MMLTKYEYMATTPDVTRSKANPDVAVSTAVVESVSDATDTPALELPSLQKAIDPDALDALVAERTTTASVTFRYADHVVTVEPDQTIEVVPVD